MTARPYYGAGGYSRAEDASKDDGETRKRKGGTRRTVDYGCTNAKWIMDRVCLRSSYHEKPMWPGLNEIINVYCMHLPANNRCCPLWRMEIIPPHLSQ